MSKKDMVNKLAERLNVSKKEASKTLNAVLESITEGLQEEGQLKLYQFGSFYLKERAARKGRNPQTGDPLDIPAKTVPVFRPSRIFKEIVNN